MPKLGLGSGVVNYRSDTTLRATQITHNPMDNGGVALPRYFSLYGTVAMSATESQVQILSFWRGSIKKIKFKIQVNALTGTAELVFRKNGIDSGVITTVTSSDGTGVITINTNLSFLPNDLISFVWRYVSGAGNFQANHTIETVYS